MAEPLSLAAGIVELTNTGFALGKFLNDTWLAYKNAPAEVLEIAHEVTICCELMTPLGEQLRTGSVRYTSRFQEAVEGLVRNSTTIFNRVRALIPTDINLETQRGVVPRWTYVLKKSKIVQHRKKLKEIQQMFLFMKQMMLEAPPTGQNTAKPAQAVPDYTYQYSAPAAGSPSGIKSANIGQASQHLPLTLSGEGFDERGQAVTYHATLVMRSSSPPSLWQDNRARGPVAFSAVLRGGGSPVTPVQYADGWEDFDQFGSRPPYSQNHPITPSARAEEGRKRIEEENRVMKEAAEEVVKREEQQKNLASRPPSYAKVLRQNPYFSPELLEAAAARSGIRKESNSERDARRRSSTRKSSRSSAGEENTGDGLEIPDDREAAREVIDLLTSWFGPEPETFRYAHRPSISIVNTSLPPYQPVNPSSGTSFIPYQNPFSPTVETPLPQYQHASPWHSKLPSSRQSSFPPSVDSHQPQYHPTSSSPKSGKSPPPILSPSPGLESPRSASSSGSYFASTFAQPIITYRCDSCDKRIVGGLRWECRSCKDYGLCQRCFNDPEVSIRLKNDHSKSHFESR